MVEGRIELRDQLRDYQYRGILQSQYHFLDFIINTYEDKLLPEPEEDTRPKPGRPRNVRVAYLSAAGKPTRCRVQRSNGHETLPRIIGRWFPRNDDVQQAELYAASMLLLFKPWRDFADLKAPGESFTESLKVFIAVMGKRELQILDNIQYYHECWDVAQSRRDAYRRGEHVPIFDYERGAVQYDSDEDIDRSSEDENKEDVAPPFWIPANITEEMIDKARGKQQATKDLEFAEKAMTITASCNVFLAMNGNHDQQSRRPRKIACHASQDDLDVINIWEKTLQDMTRKQAIERGLIDLSTMTQQKRNDNHHTDAIIEMDVGEDAPALPHQSRNGQNSSGEKIEGHREKLSILNVDQRRAHDLIERQVLTAGT